MSNEINKKAMNRTEMEQRIQELELQLAATESKVTRSSDKKQKVSLWKAKDCKCDICNQKIFFRQAIVDLLHGTMVCTSCQARQELADLKAQMVKQIKK